MRFCLVALCSRARRENQAKLERMPGEAPTLRRKAQAHSQPPIRSRSPCYIELKNVYALTGGIRNCSPHCTLSLENVVE